jgi:phage terminase large subunit-like protein
MNIPRTSTDPESTVEVQGYEGELTSRHYKIILFDDVVGKENSTSREQIQKVVNFYTQSLQLLKKPGGEILVIGTMWSYADLHNHIIENLYPEFDIYVRSVWSEDRFIRIGGGKSKYGWITTANTKTPLYPAMFGLEDLQLLKNEIIADPMQGTSTWMAQYELKIVDEKSAVFPRNIINEKNCWFNNDDLYEKKLAFSLSCDPAVSESKEADETAFIVRAVDDEGNWYVIDVYGERGMREEAIVNKYVQYLIDYPIDLATVETISFQRNLQYAIEKKCQEERIFFPYQKLPSGFLQGSKNNSDLKIRGLASLYTTGRIKFRKGDDQTLTLLDQLWRFPKSNKDDRADSLSQHLWLPIIASRVWKTNEIVETISDLDRYGHKKNNDESGLYI